MQVQILEKNTHLPDDWMQDMNEEVQELTFCGKSLLSEF